jgi:L-fucose isomerase-like protein
VSGRNRHVPNVGFVSLAFPGYYLGEEKAAGKHGEILKYLHKLPLKVIDCGVATDTSAARGAGNIFAERRVDCIFTLLTTFVPDHFIVEILDAWDVPVFLYALEREFDCISLVGGMLTNPTLYDLGKQYQLHAGDFSEAEGVNSLTLFARAAMMRRILGDMRVGYMGKNPDTMLSMQVDEYGLKKKLGVSVVPLRDFEYSDRIEAVPDAGARKDWAAVKEQVGRSAVSNADGVEASKAFIAMVRMAEEKNLDALSINCWTQLKSRICLPIARFNEMGIGAGCEGDLHSTILLRLLYAVNGRAAINGDFMRLFNDENQILFSHCGAGSFSMARSSKDIVLHESIETRDGIGVFFPADQPGTATAVNLMGSRAGYRMAVLVGEVEQTDMCYEGNPMRIRFDRPVYEILQYAVRSGAGHHWTIAYGDLSGELELLARFLDIDFHILSTA